jgi:hypothetical protein
MLAALCGYLSQASEWKKKASEWNKTLAASVCPYATAKMIARRNWLLPDH